MGGLYNLSPPFFMHIRLILKRFANKQDDCAHTHAHTLMFGRKVRLHDHLNFSVFLRRQNISDLSHPLSGLSWISSVENS